MAGHPEQVPAADPIRVVIADDTFDIRDLLRFVLTVDGRFEVVGEAADGLEAVERAATLKPDAVVLDLAMPKMDGLQAIPQIRRRSPESAIIVLSAFAASTMREEVLSLGADAYVEKGGAFSELPPLLLRLCRDQYEEPVPRSRTRGAAANGERREGSLPGDEVSHLLSIVAHEMRNPITVIQGFSTTLSIAADQMDSAGIHHAAGAIERQAKVLSDMTHAFTDARMIEVGALDLQRQGIDVGGMIRQHIADLFPITSPHPVIISAAPMIVSIDPDRVRQILTNLVSNAAKFSVPGESIEVDLSADVDSVRIEVRDRCEGIPEGKEGELFRKFSRPLNHVKGTGLGLYVSKGIAQAHGGDLRFERREGGGCRFILEIPL